MASSSRSQVNIRVRVRVRDLTHILFFFIFLSNHMITPSICFRSFSTYSSSSSVSYAQYCNSVVPKSNPKALLTYKSSFPQLKSGYFNGGGAIVADNSSDSSSLKPFIFRTQNVYTTEVDDVLMVEASLMFRVGYKFSSLISNLTTGMPKPKPRRFRTRGPRLPLRRRRLGFSLNGFWSESSGKLCMVGTGTAYSSKQGDTLDLSAVFKLNFPNSSTIFTSLVTGSLESVDSFSSMNYFKPITVLAFSQRNYEYTLISQDKKATEFSQRTQGSTPLALPLEVGTSVCSKLVDPSKYELEYGSDCFGSKNCTPIIHGGLPEVIFFSDVQCSDAQHLRLFISFSNASYTPYNQPLVLDRMLIGEGFWDLDNNRLCLVACRVLNFTDSLVTASVGDCSVRLSVWFPAIMSIKNRSSIVGQIWSNKTMNESGNFDKLVFRSPKNRISVVPGLKYKYTEMDRVAVFCPKKTAKGKGARYPSGVSLDMKFDMRVKNNRRVQVWGYAVPVSVGDQFYERRMEISPNAMAPETSFRMEENQRTLLNISYSIRLTPDYHFGVAISPDGSLNLNAPVEISAEGIYNVETGNLCMVGCRYVKLSKNHSLDCEILVNIQFRPLDSEESEYVKGTIKSTRGSSDPLFFEILQLSAISLTSTQAKESVWRMDFEVTMVLMFNTLICIFVGLQIFYVKKHPDVLHSISFVMIAILTLGQMIPLVLNFEALFLTNHNRQNVMMGNGGWLEVNEVLVRIVTMVSFLFQFRLLQLTWSSKFGDENQKSLVLAEKKSLYVLLPLYLVGAFVAWGVHWWDSYHDAPLGHGIIAQHSLWGILRSYAGLILDGFLLPQILFNLFWNSKDKALCPAFYVGITSVHLLPHAYDLYRANRYVHYLDASYIYANPGGDFFSTAWDVIIPCGGLLFAFIIYLQQRFGGSCILPPRFRQVVSYEKVPVVNSD